MKHVSAFAWIAVILLVVPALVAPVRAETRIEKNLLEGKMGKGGELLRIRASGGSVRLFNI